MAVLVALQLGFTLWMVVDSIQRLGYRSWWPYFIFFIPFSCWIYFFIEKWPELRVGSATFQELPSVETLRYAYQESPSLDNELRLAAALLDEGEIDEARQLYQRAVRQDDRFARAHYGLGLTAMAKEEPATALECFRRVRELDRSYADWGVWLDLAAAQRAVVDLPGALETLRQLHRAQPRIDHSVALAQELHAQAMDEEARAVVERALEDDRQAPGHVRRSGRRWAREASVLLGELG